MNFALTIAGTDGSGGAGVSADLRVMHSLDVRGTSVITTVVSQRSGKVDKIEPLTAEMVASQIRVIAPAFPVNAIKIGMTWSAEIVEAIVSTLWELKQNGVWSDAKIILDPVGIASTGDMLSSENWAEAFVSMLLPMADIVTPNLAEAEWLNGGKKINLQNIEVATRELSDQFGCSVFVKGGHLVSDDVVDVFSEFDGKTKVFQSERIDKATEIHGTGCVLSSAIACYRAKGFSRLESVTQARNYLRNLLENPLSWDHGGDRWVSLD